MQDAPTANVPQRNLTFNLDGSIDPEQLVGMPQEIIDRVTSPEFQKEAAATIASHRRSQVAEYNFRKRAREIRAAAAAEHELRRPSGISGRQRNRLRRAARKSARATILSGVQTDGKP
jgi:hypothetical protein